MVRDEQVTEFLDQPRLRLVALPIYQVAEKVALWYWITPSIYLTP